MLTRHTLEMFRGDEVIAWLTGIKFTDNKFTTSKLTSNLSGQHPSQVEDVRAAANATYKLRFQRTALGDVAVRRSVPIRKVIEEVGTRPDESK